MPAGPVKLLVGTVLPGFFVPTKGFHWGGVVGGPDRRFRLFICTTAPRGLSDDFSVKNDGPQFGPFSKNRGAPLALTDQKNGKPKLD